MIVKYMSKLSVNLLVIPKLPGSPSACALPDKLSPSTAHQPIIFHISKGRLKLYRKFSVGTDILEIVDNYKYFGLFYKESGSFCKLEIHIAEQTNKAMVIL